MIAFDTDVLTEILPGSRAFVDRAAETGGIQALGQKHAIFWSAVTCHRFSTGRETP